jgi:iron complex transport system permease protein
MKIPFNPRLNSKQKMFVLISMGITVVLCFLLAIQLGSVDISTQSLIRILNPFSDSHVESNLQLIIEKIRLPRALLALLIGATLASCGTVTQGLFRNPLADPSLIGVSAGASIGATAVIALGSHWIGNDFSHSTFGISMVSMGAFFSALITVLLVYKLSTSHRGTSVATMLLAGIAITALAGGFTSLLEYISDSEALRRISLWRMGGLDGANYLQVLLMASVVLTLTVLFNRYSAQLNALLLGESEARHLGISVQKTKLSLIVLVAAGVGFSVSIAGGIGFIGLIVPHIMRLIIGPDHRFLIPATLMAGAILLLLADTVSRTIIAPAELPVGIITALIGAPFFISLLQKRHQYGMQEG